MNYWITFEKSLQVVDHAPDGFSFGYNGSGPAQLSAALLFEVTGDPELTRRYYQLFKADRVSQWDGDTFELTGGAILDWLMAMGARIEPPQIVLRETP